MADQTDTKTEEKSNRPKRKKRPDIAIYTPVHRRNDQKQQSQNERESERESTETRHSPSIDSGPVNGECSLEKEKERKDDKKLHDRMPEKGLYVPAKTSLTKSDGDNEMSESPTVDKIKVISSPPIAIPSVAEVVLDWAEEVENELYGTPDDTATFLDAYERSGWADPSIVLEAEKHTVEIESKEPDRSVTGPVIHTLVFERSTPADDKVNDRDRHIPADLGPQRSQSHQDHANRGSHHGRTGGDHDSHNHHRDQTPQHQGQHGEQHHSSHGLQSDHRGSHPPHHSNHQHPHHGNHQHHGDHHHRGNYVAHLPPRLQAKQQERLARENSKYDHQPNQDSQHEHSKREQRHDEHDSEHPSCRTRGHLSRDADHVTCHDTEESNVRRMSRRGRMQQKHEVHNTANDICQERSQSPGSAPSIRDRSDLSPHVETPVSSPGTSPAGRRGAGRGKRRVKQSEDVSDTVSDMSLNEPKHGVIVLPKDSPPSLSPIGRGRGRAGIVYNPNHSERRSHGPSLVQSVPFHEIHSRMAPMPEPNMPMPVPLPFQQRVPPMPLMPIQMTNMGAIYPPFMLPPPMPERFLPMYDPSVVQPPPPVTAVDRRRSDMLRQEVAALEQKLFALTSQRAMPDTNREMSRCRIEMTIKCEELILNDAESAQKWGIDQILWKSVYYTMLTVYRNLDLDEDENRAGLSSMLEEGISFYGKLLRKVEQRYDFSLQNYFLTDRPRPDGEPRLVKFSLVIAQALMLNLGDLHRYKDDYNQAKSCYMKAQMLMPKNSQSYSRLAVLATSTKKWLDSVYYHMRSLEVGNANPAAREALVSMFEEVRKKAEFERQRTEVASNQRGQCSSKEPARVEIWIAPDGSKAVGKSETPTTIYKRFVLNYLFAQGKLYSKTGLEDLADVCGSLYKDFERVLSMESSPLDQDRLLKLVVINIFMVHHTGPVEGERSSQKLLRQDYSLVLGLDMFAIMVRHFVHLLSEHTRSPNYPSRMLEPRLRTVYPAIKVWSDWMTFTQRVWNPPPTEDLGSSHDLWNLLADMGTLLERIDISHVHFLSERIDGCEPLILPEDLFVEGYKPLIGLERDPTYVHSTCDKDHARDCLRVQKLQYLCEFLSGLVPAVLRFSVEKRCYFSAVEHYIYSDGSASSGTTQSEDESEEETVVELDGVDVEANETVQQLKAKKQQLQKQMVEINKQKSDHQALLDQERSRGVELEIRPLFLVPDTNCFIDHLSCIVQLLTTSWYTIIVPLVVINELDKLARGQERPVVMKAAQKVVRFLEEAFEVKREPRLKAMTSKGTLLDTIAYRSESIGDDKGNNDDLILSCCLHYCQDMAKNFMPKNPDDPIKLYREVVLLTDDRNLRLKAHTRNLPVKDLISFMEYAGLSES